MEEVFFNVPLNDFLFLTNLVYIRQHWPVRRRFRKVWGGSLHGNRVCYKEVHQENYGRNVRHRERESLAVGLENQGGVRSEPGVLPLENVRDRSYASLYRALRSWWATLIRSLLTTDFCTDGLTLDLQPFYAHSDFAWIPLGREAICEVLISETGVLGIEYLKDTCLSLGGQQYTGVDYLYHRLYGPCIRTEKVFLSVRHHWYPDRQRVLYFRLYWPCV